MNEIYILYIIFSILFLIERKAINILMNYIGITIIIAILLGISEPIKLIEGEYISYILILVQVSALTILFGFIIMLYPDYSTRGIEKTLDTTKKKIYILILLIILIFIYFFFYNLEIFSKKNIFTACGWELESSLFEWERVENFNNNTIILRKIGELLYLENNNIIKLIILTIILLLAIIALFFLIFNSESKKIKKN